MTLKLSNFSEQKSFNEITVEFAPANESVSMKTEIFPNVKGRIKALIHTIDGKIYLGVWLIAERDFECNDYE